MIETFVEEKLLMRPAFALVLSYMSKFCSEMNLGPVYGVLQENNAILGEGAVD